MDRIQKPCACCGFTSLIEDAPGSLCDLCDAGDTLIAHEDRPIKVAGTLADLGDYTLMPLVFLLIALAPWIAGLVEGLV